MTGAMRKMGVYLGLVEDDAHDDLEAHESASRARDYDRPEPTERPTRARRDDTYGYADAEDSMDDLRAEPAARAAEPAPVFDRRPVADRSAAIDRAAAADRIARTDRYAAPRAAEAPVAPQRITTLHPRTYNEARTIGEQFRDGNPVIMNLTELEDADAKRLVDFAAGLTFGLRGSFERITAKVFLLSPQKVKVTAEDKARIADGRYPVRG